MGIMEIKVPDIGDFKDVEVIEIMVKVGDTVKKDQSLIVVESDKASMEIPASHAGAVKEILLKMGDKVSEGSAMLLLETAEDTSLEPQKAVNDIQAIPERSARIYAQAAVPAPVEHAVAHMQAPEKQAMGKLPHASPSVRKFARELGVNLQQVKGSAPKGRILREDVQAYVKKALSGNLTHGGAGGAQLDLLPWPSLDFSQFGTTELQPLSRIKKISGPNLHRNWVMIPHVTQYEDADVTDLEAFRRSSNEKMKGTAQAVRLTMLAFVIKACVTVLKRYPEFNASLDASGENLILKKYYHIGFAADTVYGLVVPVIRDADKKGVLDIAREMAELSALAREGKLNPSDMQGASFTITSLGGIGGTYFTPLINAPEVAIVGLSRMNMQPVWDGNQFVPRLILPLSLSYDHRVIDGAQGTRFTSALAEVLGDMRNTLL